MYLKRLEIYGFKTFADRTELEFGEGITAIVGPNGSGKSNISDSLLWVLGETGMKSLRSAKHTDIIFNGSDARKALGLAEVHLTLDNATGFLPTDYSEVTVTRRIFRSGESEYLINRVPVRLRDVHDLFMDTGIGKQSYSIISQGEVDAVLSSRSEERRALFEEAAGITKYKSRKKEALRKLEQTRLNLLRVSDIIGELETQLGPLAEQSEQAQRYQGLHEELTRLQLSLLVTQYTGLKSSLARAREREEELKRELEELRHAVGQAETREATLRAELVTIEDDLEERRSVEQRLAGAVQAAENQVAMRKQQEEHAARERDRLLQEREALAQQGTSFAEEIARAETEQARLREILAAFEAELSEATMALNQAHAALDAGDAEVRARRGAYLDVLDKAAKERNELARVESLLRTSEGRAGRIAAEQAELAGKLQEREAALAAAKAQVVERGQAREALLRQRTEAARARQAAQDRQSVLRRDEAKARESLAGMRARQRILTELEQNLEGYFPGVRAVAAASSQGKLAGWFAPASELIDVPAELETAIEVALGADLQNVVCDTEASARAAVGFLKQTRAGRATFLPLDLINPSQPASVPPAPGILGVAMHLVGFDPAHEVVARHLLGRIIIAENLDAALALAKSNQARGWKSIVTLEGEVVTPARAITGGAQARGGGLLARKRELQELVGQVESAEREATKLQRQVQESTAEAQRLDAEMTALAKQMEQAATAVAEAERGVATSQRDVAALADRNAALAKEAEWMARELAEAKADEAKHLATLNTLEAQQREAEDAIAEAERAQAGGALARDDISAEVGRLRVRATETRGELQTQAAAARRAAELHDGLAGRLAQQATEAEALGARIAELQTGQQSGAAEVERLRQALGQSGGALDATRARRTGVLDAIAACLEAQKSGRDAVEECTGRLHRAELRSTQVETEIGFLEGQFFEDYRLTPDQAIARAEAVENRGQAVVRLKDLQAGIDELGTVNLGAIEEFQRVHERLGFLTAQRKDLDEGRDSLAKVIAEIDATCREKFLTAFEAIAREFQDLFSRLFGGGKTVLSLVDPSDVLESGIDIDVTIPGKRNQNLLQLSGGERALTALALLFAMLRVKPSPFVVLDEIDAPLDEANVGRYCEVLRDFTRDTQFLIITHNKGTMEAADVLYGVTMEKAGVSRIVSVRLSDGRQGGEALVGG